MTTLSETSSPAAGPSLEGMTAPAHHLKLSKCTTRTNRRGAPWRYARVWVDGKIKLRPFRCPNCDEEIRLSVMNPDNSSITCWRCAWIPALLTPAQLDLLEEDPEELAYKEHKKEMEKRDNKNHINGKSKRNRKAISRACY